MMMMSKKRRNEIIMLVEKRDDVREIGKKGKEEQLINRERKDKMNKDTE